MWSSKFVYIAKWSWFLSIIIHSVFFFLWWLGFTLLAKLSVCNTGLLTIIPMLYITSAWLALSLEVCTFDPLHPFCPSPSPHLWRSLFCLCTYELDFLLLFGEGEVKDSVYKWDHTVLSCLISFNILPSRFMLQKCTMPLPLPYNHKVAVVALRITSSFNYIHRQEEDWKQDRWDKEFCFLIK